MHFKEMRVMTKKVFQKIKTREVAAASARAFSAIISFIGNYSRTTF
jgi:hypothetical protein